VRAVLTYHSIDSTGSVISVSPDTLESHVRALAAGVAVLPLTDLLSAPDDRDAVAITFDDAYTNFAREAWPRLKAHGLPATLFVPTRFAGAANEWPELPGGRMPRLPILDWPSLARLAEDGVDLGSHSRTHPDLRTLDASRLEDEIAGAAHDILRETGRRPAVFSYPYGFWTPAAAEVVRATYEAACTTELRLLHRSDDRYLLPRLDVYYLRGPAEVANFGRWTFREYLRARLAARTVRQHFRRT
jgi:peptidoglycan/xylan/chitin deacetylase (PgdA/CDA1 family)